MSCLCQRTNPAVHEGPIQLAAYAVLLHRYSGQDDIVIGSPVANRQQVELEQLIGFFVNALAMRVRVNRDVSFRELVAQVRDTVLEAFVHQDLPFERLVEELTLRRSLNTTPIFQVTFTLHNAAADGRPLRGLEVKPVTKKIPTVRFDLELHGGEAEGKVFFNLLYNRDLFDGWRMEQFARHYGLLLEMVSVNPDQRIGLLNLLSAKEQKQIIEEWNDTSRTYGRTRTIQEMFGTKVAQIRDAVAVESQGEEISYGQLNKRANQLAHYLRKQGVGSEVPVGICIERGIEMVVGMVGILKAGGAYVPLDPEYPVERLEMMMEDAGIAVIVSREKEAENLPGGRGKVVNLDGDREEIGEESDSEAEERERGENVAYVIYTSGSTGEPKGVGISHSAVRRLIENTNYIELIDGERMGQASSSTFDAATFEIWGSLLRGGRLVVIAREVMMNPGVLKREIREKGVEVMFMTTALFNAMARTDGRSFGELKELLFGGEAVEPRWVREVMERGKPGRLVHVYGPTESTTFATWEEVKEVEEGARTVGIGRPVANTRAYVVDDRQQAVPVGTEGELCLAGEGLARGYVGKPMETAEGFIPDPFNPVKGQRMYRTGDQVRYGPNGSLEYVGRADHQVKVRGYRMELEEIESAIQRWGGVREAVVVVKEQEREKTLVGCVVMDGGGEERTRELSEYLKQKLPGYMVPGQWVTMEEMPMTGSGKIDRRRLSELIEERGEESSTAGYVEARTEQQMVMVEVWREVLGVERIGIRDNFFDLGGDSIRSIRVLSIARQHGLNFPMQALFEHPTIEDLVSKAERAEEERERVERFSLISEEDRRKVPEGVEDAYPLSRLQEGMLFHSELAPDTAVYHDIISLEVHGNYDGEVIRAVVKGLMSRHEIFRTSFDLTSFSEGMQLVHEGVEEVIDEEDLRGMEEERQEREVSRWIEQEKKRAIDWKKAPLMRIKIHQRSVDRFELSMSFHHAMLDGWSFASLLTELFQEYWRVQSGGEEEEMEAPETKYREYIALEREAMRSQECERYWREKLEGCEMTKFGWGRRWMLGQGGRSRLDLEIEGALFDGVKGVAGRLGVPLKSALLAAHLKVQSVLSGEKDVLSGIATNGRLEERDGDRVLGLFLNSLPVRVQIGGGSWEDLVREAFKAEREMLKYRRYPLSELQNKMGGSGLFDTLFMFLNFHVLDGMGKAEGLRVAVHRQEVETNYGLVATFITNSKRTGLHLNLEYREGVIGERGEERVLEYYRRALKCIAEDPKGNYENTNLLSREELHQVIVEWNDSRVDWEPGLCVQDLFEQQVVLTPDAVAVECGEWQITYLKLDTSADLLAGRLRTLGVVEGDMIGVCLDRSV